VTPYKAGPESVLRIVVWSLDGPLVNLNMIHPIHSKRDMHARSASDVSASDQVFRGTQEVVEIDQRLRQSNCGRPPGTIHAAEETKSTALLEDTPSNGNDAYGWVCTACVLPVSARQCTCVNYEQCR
jgi:hypothetical protein